MNKRTCRELTINQKSDTLLCNIACLQTAEKKSCKRAPVSASPKEFGKQITGSGRILVLDGSAVIAPSGLRALTRHGYKITKVETMEEAVKISQQDPHELLVLDVKEPELLGMLLSQFPPTTGILIISDRNSATEDALYSGTGIHSFLASPFDTGQLVAAVSQAAEKSG
jgi:DNA-binding NtrC family response regulator